MSPLRSEDPWSMTIISHSRSVCIKTERTAAPTVDALFRIDMMTDTTGERSAPLIGEAKTGCIFHRRASDHGQQGHAGKAEAGLDDMKTPRKFPNDLIDRACGPDIVIRFRQLKERVMR